MYIINGKTLSQISKETGISVRTLRSRISDHWDMGKITTPVRNQAPRGSLKDFVVEQAAKQGLTKKAIQMRILRGWSKDEVIAGKRNKSKETKRPFVMEQARIQNVSESTIYSRLYNGWSREEVIAGKRKIPFVRRRFEYLFNYSVRK